jgi:hypothetical protein
MSLLRFLIVFCSGTVLSWAAWVLVIMMLNPTSGGAVALLLFFSSFFMALVGTATIIGFFLRYWMEQEKIPFRQIGIALRQAVILGTVATIALMLQGQRMLNIWSLLIMIVLAIIVESFFLAGQATRRTNHA